MRNARFRFRTGLHRKITFIYDVIIAAGDLERARQYGVDVELVEPSSTEESVPPVNVPGTIWDVDDAVPASDAAVRNLRNIQISTNVKMETNARLATLRSKFPSYRVRLSWSRTVQKVKYTRSRNARGTHKSTGNSATVVAGADSARGTGKCVTDRRGSGSCKRTGPKNAKVSSTPPTKKRAREAVAACGHIAWKFGIAGRERYLVSQGTGRWHDQRQIREYCNSTAPCFVYEKQYVTAILCDTIPLSIQH